VTDRALDAALLRAHDLNDLEGLVALYRQAGLACLDVNDVDAGCFYLTHSYIFALEMGSPKARGLHEILVAHGREE